MKGFQTLQNEKEEKIREEKQAQQRADDLKIIGDEEGKTTIIYEESNLSNGLHTFFQIIKFFAIIAGLAALYYFVIRNYI